jgi:outer membrane protein assembly factor BamB
MNHLFARPLPFRLLAGLLFLLPAAPPGHGGETWPSLHNGGNTSINARLPLVWSPEKGIAWSAALPGYGQSAPVVWGGRVYVTAVEGDNKETYFVHAYDARTGRRAWEHRVPASVKTKTSYMVSRAAPTPVVDRDGVYALFESGDLHALTHDGKKRWAVALFDAERKFENTHGYGASPTQTSKAVVVLVDHRGPSYLLALSKETGKPLWKTERKSRSSWTSPQSTRVGQEQVIVSSSGTVDGYDAQTGKLLWSHTGLSGNGIPSVTVQGDRVYVGASFGQQEKNGEAIAASNCCLRITPLRPRLLRQRDWGSPLSRRPDGQGSLREADQRTLLGRAHRLGRTRLPVPQGRPDDRRQVGPPLREGGHEPALERGFPTAARPLL